MCCARRWRGAGLLGLLGLLATTGQALESDRSQPIHIKADQISVNEKQGFSRYRGNVKLKQGSLQVAADEISVYLKGERLDKIVILGDPATLQQRAAGSGEEIRSRARRMEYHAAANRLYLYDGAEVIQGPNRFAGDYIEYDTRSSTVSARKGEASGSRVEITITPEEQSASTKPPKQENSP